MRATILQDSVRSGSRLTSTQIAELAGELRDDLQRLEPNPTGVLHSRSQELDRRAQVRRSLILDALTRLDAGSYGICLGCDDPIPYARLAAIPEARTCIDCAVPRH